MYAVSAIDENVKISLRGVVGFSQIVLKLVEVMDAELIKAEKSIDCFVSQIKEFTPYPNTLPHENHKAEKRIEGVMRSAGFLPPKHSAAFVQLLRDKAIIRL